MVTLNRTGHDGLEVPRSQITLPTLSRCFGVSMQGWSCVHCTLVYEKGQGDSRYNRRVRCCCVTGLANEKTCESDVSISQQVLCLYALG